MDPTNRPNILTVGVIAGAVAQLVVWLWNAFVSLAMGPGEAAALTTILTALAQWLDRNSKRDSSHVLTKHGTDDVRKDAQ